MKRKRVLIIGGGAAGMMAACGAAEAGHNVTLLEKNGRLGRKLALTGNGRCNVTNASDPEELLDHVVSHRNFLYSAFYGFSNEDMIRFLREEGLETKVEADNRVFPVTDQAADVIRALEGRMKRTGVQILLNRNVKRLLIDPADGAESSSRQICKGVELTNDETIPSDVTILATGGLSYPVTGSDGEGLRMAEACGHTVRAPRPALTPFVIREQWPKELQGRVFQDVRMKVSDPEGNRLFEDSGDILFTHFGISGPMVLAASSYCTGFFRKREEFISSKLKKKTSEGNNVFLHRELTVTLDFFPEEDPGQLERRLQDQVRANGKKQLRSVLENLAPKSFVPVLLELAGVDSGMRAAELPRQTRLELVRCMKSLPLHISGTKGFREAMVTQGGVSVEEVNPGTMESLQVDGLRFAGEILDLDALTGGYNLQIAWSTGWAAGSTIE